jgi:YtkA-like
MPITMRVRPFFWFLLIASCLGVLIFAAAVREDIAAVMQVHMEQQPKAGEITTLNLHLTDPQGLPLEDASVFSQAQMTNMKMGTNQSSVKYLGQGDYAVQLQFSMTGPWLITFQALANGFDPLQQTMFVRVQ